MNKDYVQPDFYRFNEDSLELVAYVKKNVSQVQSILDLGSGCGVIGIELARYLSPELVSFCELQEDYKDFLEKNIAEFLPPKVQFGIHFCPFSRLQLSRKFDLIVCNPPYYLPGKGELPMDPKRAKARTFLQDDWMILLDCIKKHLAPQGKAFAIVKHNVDLLNEITKLSAKSGLLNDQHIEKSLIILKFVLPSLTR